MFKPDWLVDMCHVSTCSCFTMVKPQWLQVHACVMFLPDKVRPLLSSSVSCMMRNVLERSHTNIYQLNCWSISTVTEITLQLETNMTMQAYTIGS